MLLIAIPQGLQFDAALSKGEEIPLTEEEEEFMADKYEQYGHVVGMLGALASSRCVDLWVSPETWAGGTVTE